MSTEFIGITLMAGLVTILIHEIVRQGALTRFLLKEFVRLFVVMELLALRLVRAIYPPRHVVTGGCQRRGVCCTMILLDAPRVVKDRPWLLGVFVAYHRIFHNFYVVGRGDNDEVIFRCDHLADNNSCGIYRYRPFICRNYPVVFWFDPPRPLPGCGYGVAHRSSAGRKPRASLPILYGHVAVHHPTRLGGRDRPEEPDDYVLVDLSPCPEHGADHTGPGASP